MNNQLMSATIIIISSIIVMPTLLLLKRVKVRLLSIFIILFVIGQLIGYGLDIGIMKAVTPDCDKGFCYQIGTSTILPFLIALIADYLSDKVFRIKNREEKI